MQESSTPPSDTAYGPLSPDSSAEEKSEAPPSPPPRYAVKMVVYCRHIVHMLRWNRGFSTAEVVALGQRGGSPAMAAANMATDSCFWSGVASSRTHARTSCGLSGNDQHTETDGQRCGRGQTEAAFVSQEGCYAGKTSRKTHIQYLFFVAAKVRLVDMCFKSSSPRPGRSRKCGPTATE